MRTRRSLKLTALAAPLALACAALALAQAGGGKPAPAPAGAGSPYDEQVKALLARPEIQAAFADVERSRDAIVREWIAITEINAPSGKEAERAAFIESLLRGYKSLDVRRDSAGNIIATRRGAGGGPLVVIDAHMDTVFQEGLKVKVERREGRLYAPGS